MTLTPRGVKIWYSFSFYETLDIDRKMFFEYFSKRKFLPI